MLDTKETGDETYEERKKRFEYIMARRAEKPRPTLEQIGKELGISRQNVWRTIDRGVVKPSGRPRSNEGRRRFQLKRLEAWQRRRNAKLAQGILDTPRENEWIAKIEAIIQTLD